LANHSNLPTSEGKSKSKASENKGSFLQKQTATSWKRPNSGLECKMRTLLGVLDPAATFQTRVVKKKKEKNTALWWLGAIHFFARLWILHVIGIKM
jgi:hypothetical protein